MQKNPVLEGNIRHNLGTACAELFLFDEAAANFLNAYRLNQNRESLAACMAAWLSGKKTDILKNTRKNFMFRTKRLRVCQTNGILF